MFAPLLLLAVAAADAPAPNLSVAEARHVCLATRPHGRVTGDAEARDAHDERRRALMKEKRLAVIPLTGLDAGDADETERKVELLRREALRTTEGVLLFTAQRRFVLDAGDRLPATGPHALAHALTELRRSGKGALHVTYELVDADGNGPCPALAAPGSVPVLTVSALDLALVDAEGNVLATGRGADAPEARSPAGGTPTVEVAPATVTGKGPLASAVTAKAQERLPALQACFQEALGRDATLDGALVFQVEIDAAGKGRKLTVSADTVQDEALVACARKAIEGVAWGPGGPSSALVPVHFERR